MLTQLGTYYDQRLDTWEHLIRECVTMLGHCMSMSRKGFIVRNIDQSFNVVVGLVE